MLKISEYRLGSFQDYSNSALMLGLHHKAKLDIRQGYINDYYIFPSWDTRFIWFYFTLQSYTGMMDYKTLHNWEKMLILLLLYTKRLQRSAVSYCKCLFLCTVSVCAYTTINRFCHCCEKWRHPPFWSFNALCQRRSKVACLRVWNFQVVVKLNAKILCLAAVTTKSIPLSLVIKLII